MTVHQFPGEWSQLKESAKNRWGKLTEHDLDQIEGNAETLVRRLQERYGYPRQLVLLELGNFLQTQK